MILIGVICVFAFLGLGLFGLYALVRGWLQSRRGASRRPLDQTSSAELSGALVWLTLAFGAFWLMVAVGHIAQRWGGLG